MTTVIETDEVFDDDIAVVVKAKGVSAMTTTPNHWNDSTILVPHRLFGPTITMKIRPVTFHLLVTVCSAGRTESRTKKSSLSFPPTVLHG
jgi:hypothetical protein